MRASTQEREPAGEDTAIGADVARYFSCPELLAEAGVPQLLTGVYASAVYELAFERLAPSLEAFCPSVAAQRDRVVGQPLPWAAAWHPDLAELERLVMKPGVSPERAWRTLAPMMIRLGAEGVLTEGDIRVEAPARFFWGNLRLPEANRVTFAGDGAKARIQIFPDGGQPLTIEAERLPDGLWRSDDALSVGVVRLCGHPILLWTPEDGRGYPHPGQRSPLPDALAQVEPAMREAGDLLARHSPTFVPWIASVMRHIVPLDATDGIRMSASIEEFPGLTFLSFPNPPVDLAETLAHEASHHHFLALQRLTPLHDGADTKEYFSPIKGKGRRIELILYAFHAFANAAIYHRNLVRGGNPQYDRLNGRSLAESLERIRVMHGYLGETRSLTEAGETLWKPLAETLFDA
jgi:HEXXH motif-containing protein